MSITKATRAVGGEYASVADLLAADDLPQEDVTIHWPTKQAPQLVRVRALGLIEREQAKAAAMTADVPYILALYQQYFRYGMVVPQFNEEQAIQFTAKHAGTVQQLGDFIHQMTEPDYGARIAAIAAELGSVEQADDAAATPAKAKRKAA